MNSPTIGFIGGGRITRIFLGGWELAQKTPQAILVSDPNSEVLGALQARFPEIRTTADNSLAAGQDLVFLAVHPPVLAEAAASVRDHLKPDATVVSLAPKFTIASSPNCLAALIVWRG